MKAKTKQTKTAKSSVPGETVGKTQSTESKRSQVATHNQQSIEVAHVRLSHPDRVYWVDVGVTKQQLADYYVSIWDWIAPHIVNRPLALVRCPEGTKGQCFFQKPELRPCSSYRS